jgi:endonuclease/exonuclease/phosphatase (EEP) superfamily protein YafD
VTAAHIWVRTLTGLAVVCLVVAVAGLLLHQVPTPWQPTIAAASGARMAMWLAVPSVAVALAARQWILAGIAAAALLLGLIIQVPYYLAAAATPGPARLTVLQANLKLGSADPAALVRIVRADRVDLLATEELTTEEQRRLRNAGIDSLLPFQYTEPAEGGRGRGLWSRYPLGAAAGVPGFPLGVLQARITAPSGTLTFVAVHLQPPYPYPPGEWVAETARLHSLLRQLPGPTIVAGDFNATVDLVQFRHLLADGYADAARQAGAGYLATYPADRWYGPLIGIDHVLTRGAVATSVRTVALPGSDHRGVLAQITFTS